MQKSIKLKTCTIEITSKRNFNIKTHWLYLEIDMHLVSSETVN